MLILGEIGYGFLTMETISLLPSKMANNSYEKTLTKPILTSGNRLCKSMQLLPWGIPMKN